MNEINNEILKRANVWLNGNYDEETKKQVKKLIDSDPKELTESFYRDLEFGTGGLRGIMGVGTNRMNKYTVAMATQGLANYLIKMFPNVKPIKLAIAYDSRNNSSYFAQITAEVLSANNFKVYLFDSLRPTPELSFTIRHFGCQSGIVITASHNPKEYNGYKVYWDDGGQLINPHDENVINEVLKITDINDVKFDKIDKNIEIIGENIDKIYLEKQLSYSLSPKINAKHKDLKIVYSPLHGTGVKLVPSSLRNFGFTNIFTVDEQCIPDGNFPTVKSPNPEEPAALSLAIKKAQEIDAELVLATDPDADRVGIAVKNNHNEFILLNGNQTASILTYYLINSWKNNEKITGKEYVVKTIVTTELIKSMADKNNVGCYDVLTGFKFIADIIKQLEGKKTFIGGGEESYGYLIGDYVRDKDAVISCSMIAETAAWAKEKGKSLFDLLIDIYIEFGFYKEGLISLTKKGIDGIAEIDKMMKDYRLNPFKEINNSEVIMIKDYLTLKEKNLITNKETEIKLPKSNVLQFYLKDGSKITVRPSGTEPKIKFYFGVKSEISRKEDFDKVNIALDKKIEDIINSMNLK